jgi:eukaryotic-like serine/threonine-protein kinase
VPQPGIPPQAARRLTPEDIERATQLLAVQMGPIAQVLAKRAAKPGSSREEFIARLASYLSDDGERARFLSALG